MHSVIEAAEYSLKGYVSLPARVLQARLGTGALVGESLRDSLLNVSEKRGYSGGCLGYLRPKIGRLEMLSLGGESVGSPEDGETLPPITDKKGGCMIRLARNLCITILTVHLTVGCCTSFAHRCRTRLSSWRVPRGTVVQRRCQQCRCESSHRGPKECQHPKRPVTARRRPTDGPAGSQFPASFAVVHHGCFSRCEPGLQQHSSATGRLLMPVRLHLANRVLLI